MGEPKLEEKYSYADYLTWSDDERWELIDGTPYNMSPAPKWQHQDVSTFLISKIWNFLDKKPCKVFSAPFDVVFTEEKNNEEIDTVVQPDISVICDKSKLIGTGCKGAPNFIIEILSESTALKDTRTKKALYEQNGVKEYWIVDTYTKSIQVYILENNKYDFGKLYEEDMDIESKSLKGFKINLKDIFEGIL